MITAANDVITTANGFKVFALTVHDELKEETEQLELYISIARKNGLFLHSSCDVCPCVREDPRKFVIFLGECYSWGHR
jgi:hypothetical protein